MAYRDDQEARGLRREALERELAGVERELAHVEACRRRAAELRRDLEALAREEKEVRRRAALPLLQRVTLSSPCHERWEGMQGDERVRHCGRCDKHVYNLTAMRREEAEALLAQADGICVRFLRRPDGTVVSGDCPAGTSRRRRNRVLGGLAALAILGAGVAAAVQPGSGGWVQGAPQQTGHIGVLASPAPLGESPAMRLEVDDPAPALDSWVKGDPSLPYDRIDE
jgi:hypothetical protein